MSTNNSIILETAIFPVKLLHHEEKYESSPENLPNFTNPLFSDMKKVNYTFTFKGAVSQPYRLDLV